VGGDFLIFLPSQIRRAGVLVCDVMGHGMRAALITAIMRGLIEELMPVAADAGNISDGNQPGACERSCGARASRFWRRPFTRWRMPRPGSCDLPMPGIPARFDYSLIRKRFARLKDYDRAMDRRSGLFDENGLSHVPAVRLR